jgi:mannitol/fructose-specific phosphotransferase system IIA component (Ntr-type)
MSKESTQESNKKTPRAKSQLAAERKHESHRISHKIVANFVTNPEFAEKLKRYKDAKKLTHLLHQALNAAPENPDDYNL